jgi:hypothetical protein
VAEGDADEARGAVAAPRRPNRASQARRPTLIDVPLRSVAIARLIEEIRNDEATPTRAYNRIYNRHNRSL